VGTREHTSRPEGGHHNQGPNSGHNGLASKHPPHPPGVSLDMPESPISEQEALRIADSLWARFCKDKHFHADDAGQLKVEAELGAVVALRRIDPSRGRGAGVTYIGSSALGYMRHYCRQQARQTKHISMFPLGENEHASADPQPGIAERIAVQQFVQQLSPRSKTVAEMLMAGHTQTEIAQIIGTSQMQVHRIKRAIGKSLETALKENRAA